MTVHTIGKISSLRLSTEIASSYSFAMVCMFQCLSQDVQEPVATHAATVTIEAISMPIQ